VDVIYRLTGLNKAKIKKRKKQITKKGHNHGVAQPKINVK